ncbi:MAG TPA: carbon-nitrogen hydrolase family protein [Microbacteriaceae bacterium]|nr:carbon-nitrogen hydrolase family protein [Microbacteriaceae bacterium]
MSVVAVAQFAPGPDPEANLATIGRLTREAVGRGAGLVVFPEYAQFFDRAPGPSWSPMAEPLDGTFVAALAELADATGATVVAGLVERSDELLKFHNTVVAVAPRHGLVASYRKLHLYDAFGAAESDWVEPGAISAPQLFDWGGLRVGLQTCYDIRFPEVTRRIVDAGADLVLVPAEWVAGPLKTDHWRTLVTARALENTVYVAGADHIPPIGVGASLIVDPMGVALATLGEAEGVAAAAVDPARIAAVRQVNPSLRLRRFRVEPVG